MSSDGQMLHQYLIQSHFQFAFELTPAPVSEYMCPPDFPFCAHDENILTHVIEIFRLN